MIPHQRRPNIIFLMTDQLVSQVLSVYGADVIDTPHIDRLASSGVTFDNMISTCPVCSPYRSMWLTGRHPQTTRNPTGACCKGDHRRLPVGPRRKRCNQAGRS